MKDHINLPPLSFRSKLHPSIKRSISVTLAGKLAGGGWTVVYHDFEADEASESVDDLGSEIDISYARKYGKHYSAGIKYAAYSGESGRVDADKLWLWVGAKF